MSNSEVKEVKEVKEKTIEERILNRDNWVKNIALIIIVAVAGYKVMTFQPDIKLEGFDFSDLLSLLLALFAILLSAMFYFKATESSNNFYDNTYKFTKDLSELVGKLDVGVNKELQNMTKGYERLYEQLDKYSNDDGDTISIEKIEKEKEKLRIVNEEKDRMINELSDKAKLQEAEREEFISELQDKNNKINMLSQNIDELNIMRNDIAHNSARHSKRMADAIEDYIEKDIFERLLDPKVFRNLSVSGKRRALRKYRMELNEAFIRDMIDVGYMTEELSLTSSGCSLMDRISSSLT